MDPLVHPPDPRLKWQIATATLSRLFLNTARRFAYPFAPTLSQGLGVPLFAATSLIAANQITGLLGLFFGPFADRIGYRLMMLIGLGALSFGMLFGGIFSTYGIVLVAFFLAGIGKSIFDPAIQAYVAMRVPFARRGWAIGIIELSWAGSSLLGIPLIGLLIEHIHWRAPFFFLGGLGIFGIISLSLLIPANPRKNHYPGKRISLVRAWVSLLKERRSLGALGYSFFVSIAYDNFFVAYGLWFENAFHLGITAIGLATIIIGVAEFLGEGLTATLADRMGLNRSIYFGMAVAGLAFLALPLTGNTLIFGLGVIFFLFLFMEFAIVCSISLFTELLPDARATMMSGFFASASLGRVLGALIGVPVWEAWGIIGTALVSASILSIGLFVLIWGMIGWKPK
ncbi:MAG: hypothetical protein A2V65_05135 [Deltaproteobacteria bacterium RBG_13_49_15]|nr:MAG: hypothetical protein A2V65_05135 [Deltaproteobacteria bacterium RBG_13_49_15]